MNRTWRWLLPLALLAAWGPPRLAGDEEVAVSVYRKVHPSVVALANLEGSGTGVLLDDTGLILTNAHVIASPLPFTCMVDILQGDELKTVTFKGVSLLGVHPDRDLALVRINPGEHAGKLQPIIIAKEKGSPGQRVFAIGNPAAGGQVLNKTITAGLISGVDRDIDGVKYYQVDAAVNPGNSGGPLVSAAGEALGIVTLKYEDVENVGFAIPLQDLDTTEFAPLSRIKGNPQAAIELAQIAEQAYEKSAEVATTYGAEHEAVEQLRMYAAYLYHQALLEDPGNSSLYYNFGMLLSQIGEHEVAAPYLLYAVQLDPWAGADYYTELGYALSRHGKEDAGRAAWEEGTAKQPRVSAKSWENLAVYWIKHDNPFQAGLCAAVTLHLADPVTRLDVMRQLHASAGSRLPEADQQRLKTETDKIEMRLDDLRLKAEKAKAGGERYLTADFRAYVASHGVIRDGARTDIKIAGGGDSSAPAETPAGEPPGGEAAPAETPLSPQELEQREQAAQSLLANGKQLAGQGKTTAAEGWYRRVIERHPDTRAAAEARGLLGLDEAEPAFRTWTDSTGQHRVEARFAGYTEDGRVKLEKKEGGEIALPLDRLSEADREHLKKSHPTEPQ